MDKRGPNASLIGKPRSRDMLMTPVLVLDLDILETNIRKMADLAKANGIGLRPHAKTHKSVNIARLQVQAGAVGISVAPIGEAQVMVDAGIANVHVTSPVVQPAKIDLLMKLNAKGTGLMVVADHPDNVAALDAAAGAAGKPLTVLVDLDVGTERTGARTPEDGFTVARRIATSSNLRFGGIQAYAGNTQHMVDYAERRTATIQSVHERIRALMGMIEREGIRVPIVTGVGTGSHDIDAQIRLFTEMQVGSYIFTDVHYNTVALHEKAARPFEPSLFVRGTVISVNQPGWVTVDTGLKRFATDSPVVPEPVRGVPPGCGFKYKGDEHSMVSFPKPGMTLPLGAGVEFVVPHCDPTVNLYDFYHVVRGDTLVDIWPVDARGCV